MYYLSEECVNEKYHYYGLISDENWQKNYILLTKRPNTRMFSVLSFKQYNSFDKVKT